LRRVQSIFECGEVSQIAKNRFEQAVCSTIEIAVHHHARSGAKQHEDGGFCDPPGGEGETGCAAF
jgi:hypothetical protein